LPNWNGMVPETEVRSISTSKRRRASPSEGGSVPLRFAICSSSTLSSARNLPNEGGIVPLIDVLPNENLSRLASVLSIGSVPEMRVFSRSMLESAGAVVVALVDFGVAKEGSVPERKVCSACNLFSLVSKAMEAASVPLIAVSSTSKFVNESAAITGSVPDSRVLPTSNRSRRWEAEAMAGSVPEIPVESNSKWRRPVRLPNCSGSVPDSCLSLSMSIETSSVSAASSFGTVPCRSLSLSEIFLTRPLMHSMPCHSLRGSHGSASPPDFV